MRIELVPEETEPTAAELFAEIKKLEGQIAAETAKLDARERRIAPPAPPRTPEQDAQVRALVQQFTGAHAVLMAPWPEAVIMVGDQMFSARPGVEGIVVAPVGDASPVAVAYAADTMGALNELRKRSNDAQVKGFLERGTWARSTLATSILDAILDHRQFGLRR
jgi:hypothetical protein